MLRQRLVAHRGFQRKYPENTLLAMREAVEAGARLIETDIQLTADLQPVLYHDAHLARISGQEGVIHDLKLEETTKIAASEPFRLGEQFGDQTITSLDTFCGFLENHKAVTAFVELKEESLEKFGANNVLEAISRPLSRIREQAVLISFNVECIALAKKRGFSRLGVVLNSWEQKDSPAITDIDPEYLFTNVNLIPSEQIELESIKPLLVVYEIDDPIQASELFNLGVDLVETFDIGGMIEALSSHSL